MKTRILTTSLLAVFSLFISCKNETGEKLDDQAPAIQIKGQTEVAKKAKPTVEELNNLMTRVMVTPELRKFTSASIVSGVADYLKNEKGPITIFAPSSEAFAALKKEDAANLFNAANKETLKEVLENHMVSGKLNTVAITENLRSGKEYKLPTLGGSEITFVKKGNDIHLIDALGNSAVLKKSDIIASNGMVHVVDAVLGNAR